MGGPGGTPLESRALRHERATAPVVDDFPDRLLELIAFLEHQFPPDHPFSKIRVTPEMPGGPQVWLLGSSEWSASAAAQLSLPYAFAHFIDPQSTRVAIEQYRSEFVPGPRLQAPRTILALGAICAETEEEAQRLYASSCALLRRFRTFPREPGLVPTPEAATAELESGGIDPAVFETGEWRRYAVGTPANVRKQLEKIVAEVHVDELMIVSIVHSHRARLRSYELLAEAFGFSAD